MFSPKQAFPILVFFLLCPAGQIVAEDSKPTLEFRLAVDVEVSGWKKMKVRDSDQPVFVSDEVVLNGSHLEKVSFSKDSSGNPSVGFTLTDDGSKAMAATTSQNLGKRLAIVLNGEIVSAPTIRSTITKEGLITGRFDNNDLLAFFHAIVLRESP